MKKLILAAAAAAMLCGPVVTEPALAAKQLKKGAVKLDPKLGYVLARIGPAHRKGYGPLVFLGRYDEAAGDLRTAIKGAPKPAKGDDSSALIGGRRSFVAGQPAGAFVTSLTPGEWVIQGTDWTCFCLGSYRFTVKAGEIVDIGTIMVGLENGASEVPELASSKVADDLLEREFVIPSVMLVKSASETDAVPGELAGLPLRRADLVPDVRFSNIGGHLINRAAGLPPFIRPVPAASGAGDE